MSLRHSLRYIRAGAAEILKIYRSAPLSFFGDRPRLPTITLAEGLAQVSDSTALLLEASQIWVEDGRSLTFDELVPVLDVRIAERLGVSPTVSRVLSEHFIIALQPYKSVVAGSLKEIEDRVWDRTWAWVRKRRPWKASRIIEAASHRGVSPQILLEEEAPLILEAGASLIPRFATDPYGSKSGVVSLFSELSRTDFYLYPEERLEVSRPAVPVAISKKSSEMLAVDSRYWNLRSYKNVVSGKKRPFERLVAFTSLAYAGEPRLKQADNAAIPWGDAACRLGSDLAGPAMNFLQNVHSYEKRWEFPSGLPVPWSLIRAAARWQDPLRAEFFDAAFKTGWVTCLKVLPFEPWMDHFITTYSRSPYGPLALPEGKADVGSASYSFVR